jgi:hypothetical protein
VEVELREREREREREELALSHPSLSEHTSDTAKKQNDAMLRALRRMMAATGGQSAHTPSWQGEREI